MSNPIVPFDEQAVKDDEQVERTCEVVAEQCPRVGPERGAKSVEQGLFTEQDRAVPGEKVDVLVLEVLGQKGLGAKRVHAAPGEQQREQRRGGREASGVPEY